MNLANYFQIAAWVGLAVAWAYNFFSSTRRQRDEQETSLISNQKAEIDLLSQRVTRQGVELREIQTTMATISGENSLMKSLLEGRDKESSEIKLRAEAAMKTVELMAVQIAESRKEMTNVLQSIEKLYKVIEKHLDKAEKL